MTSYTRVLSEFSCAVTADAIPASALEATRRLILDTLGCAVGGTGVPSSGIITRVRAAGPPQATLLVDGARVGLLSAVHVNAHRANALDAEETIRHSGHLAAATVPAALAVAEHAGSSGAEFAAAVCVGFDVAARIALSLRTLDTTPDGRTVISPVAGSSWAAFAAAVAAGRLLGLSPTAMANAFGITVASAPMPIAGRWGVQAAPRPMTKYGLYGAIAEAGVAAALLAGAGMEGDTEVLDGEHGFWRMNGSRSCDWEALTDGLGRRWLVAETSYKLFPACQYAMPALDLIYRIMADDGVAATDIDAVDVLVPAAAITKHMADSSVRTVVDGQFSIPHLVALAVRGGPPGPRWHTAAALADASVRDFAARVRVGVYDQAAPILAGLMSRQGHAHLIPTEVTVHASGRRITRTSNTGEHDWYDHAAAQDDGALRAKFRRFCEPYLAPAATEAALDLVEGITAAPSVRPLVAALVATGALPRFDGGWMPLSERAVVYSPPSSEAAPSLGTATLVTLARITDTDYNGYMPSYQFPIEATQIALFVRAAGGADVDVRDPELAAPPTFAQSGAQFDPQWPFRPRPGQPWLGSGREPAGDPAAGDGSILHAEQHFEYFRPVRPGMVLTVSTEPGQTWVKRSRSGGELHFAEQRTEYRDEEGRLVVAARSVSVTPAPAPALEEPAETVKEQP